MQANIKCLGVIPAHLSSQRLPGKPLADIAGKSLLERVFAQAKQCELISRLVVATDHGQIAECVERFGGEVIMTSASHKTGSDRAAEAATKCESGGQNYELVVNVQGDMPFIDPRIITQAIQGLIEAGESCGISTAATAIRSLERFLSPSVVKAVLSENGEGLYFSRAPLPYSTQNWSQHNPALEPFGYRHIGIYAFRREALRRFASLPQTALENRERLEQLRALGHGIRIKVSVIPDDIGRSALNVDTPEELEYARKAAQEFEVSS